LNYLVILHSLLEADRKSYLAGSLSNSATIHRDGDGKLIFRPAMIVEALKDLDLVPDIISEVTLKELITDIMPEYVMEMHTNNQVEMDTHNVISPSSSISSISFSQSGTSTPIPNNFSVSTTQDKVNKVISLPQWEWLLCLVAYHAVAFAIGHKFKHRSHGRSGVSTKVCLFFIFYFICFLL